MRRDTVPADPRNRPWQVLRSRRGRARATSDPGAAMFAGIRRRLIFWYIGVLAGALVLFGGALYIGVERLLFDPVNTTLANRAATLSAIWSTVPDLGCDAFTLPRRLLLGPAPGGALWACYDRNGALLTASPTAQLLPAFTGNELARTALRGSPAVDTVDGGSGVGAIQRYAVTVPDANGGVLGVIEVGAYDNGAVRSLRVLLTLLWILGVLTLLVTTVGGLFLSRRALAPARLAFARQQAFIADASHELRTPLALMRADAEVLLRGRDRLSRDDTALLEDIVAEAAHMGALATNMLSLARLDTGRQQMDHDVVDLADLAATMARRARALTAEMGLALDVDATRPALVIGDRLLLEQATLILIDNAMKYNRPGGTVTIRARVRERQASLEVDDTGIGIAPEHLPHLFERFYRVDKARSRESGGAGLGLSIARGIAELHGGTLTMTSVPGQGATATLALPAAGMPMRDRPGEAGAVEIDTESESTALALARSLGADAIVLAPSAVRDAVATTARAMAALYA